MKREKYLGSEGMVGAPENRPPNRTKNKNRRQKIQRRQHNKNTGPKSGTARRKNMSMRTYQHNKRVHRRSRRLARAAGRLPQLQQPVNDNHLFAATA
ncbi:MAG: hypothetical protein EP335_06735 [Alphaproteobacteria bacterium]|nr:MAG: hypothetical protein EP335_06735 [Alphaproteobacteria bacterium]